MATIRSYTTVEQSKKLAEILPLESADMAWCNNSIRGVNYTDDYSANLYTVKEMQECFDKALNGWDKYWKLIPCWSLAALINVLPRVDIEKEMWSDDTYDYRVKAYIDDGYIGDWFDNPIDACYNMIIELHKDKLL